MVPSAVSEAEAASAEALAEAKANAEHQRVPREIEVQCERDICEIEIRSAINAARRDGHAKGYAEAPGATLAATDVVPDVPPSLLTCGR
jgi:hypothetical protein